MDHLQFNLERGDGIHRDDLDAIGVITRDGVSAVSGQNLP